MTISKDEAIEWLSAMKDRNDYQRKEALDMAIEALENNDKLAEDLQNCLEMYKKKKAEVESLKQPQIIQCKDCQWWEREAEDSPIGYCHAMKHCHYSKHWEISIYRTYNEDFFCADAERREEECGM